MFHIISTAILAIVCVLLYFLCMNSMEEKYRYVLLTSIFFIGYMFFFGASKLFYTRYQDRHVIERIEQIDNCEARMVLDSTLSYEACEIPSDSLTVEALVEIRKR